MLKYANETNTTKHCTQLSSLESILSPSPLDQNPHKLEVGSTIQYGDPIEYGVLKWIGMLPGRENIQYAGVEMVNHALYT